MKKLDNKRARLIGVLGFGTYPSFADATRAACEFGADARDAGHDLSTLAVLMNKSDRNAIKITLARRHYWRSAPAESMPPDVLARLLAQDAKDSLLVLVASADGDSHLLLTLKEMTEALK